MTAATDENYLVSVEDDYFGIAGVKHYIYRYENTLGGSLITWADAFGPEDSGDFSGYFSHCNSYEVAIIKFNDQGGYSINGDGSCNWFPKQWDVYQFRTLLEAKAFLTRIKNFIPGRHDFKSYFDFELTDRLVRVPEA